MKNETQRLAEVCSAPPKCVRTHIRTNKKHECVAQNATALELLLNLVHVSVARSSHASQMPVLLSPLPLSNVKCGALAACSLKEYLHARLISTNMDFYQFPDELDFTIKPWEPWTSSCRKHLPCEKQCPCIRLLCIRDQIVDTFVRLSSHARIACQSYHLCPPTSALRLRPPFCASDRPPLLPRRW